MTNDRQAPHPADIYAGQQLRMHRLLQHMSQTDLGAQVGLTFQQIQKYERGMNRMSVSMLQDIATVLNVSPMQFFTPQMAPMDAFKNGLTMKEITSLVKVFGRISTRRKRIQVTRMIAAYASMEQPP